MDLGLEGRVCVVTGASRGIGLVTARRLREEGAVVLMVARGEDRLREAAAAVGGVAMVADVVDPGAAGRIIARAEELGGPDVLVNNAATTGYHPIDEVADDEWQAQWDINVMAAMRLMREAAPRMAARGWGRIVNVSSSSGKRPGTRNVAYSVAKAAQLSLSRAFADRWAAEGVLVNAVTPGPVATELWTEPGGIAEQMGGPDGAQAALDAVAAAVPRRRFGTPEEVGDVIAFLCSERAGNVLGAAWSVDGGVVPVIL